MAHIQKNDEAAPWLHVSLGLAIGATIFGILSLFAHTFEGAERIPCVSKGSSWSVWIGLPAGAAYFAVRYKTWPFGIFISMTLVGGVIWHWGYLISRIPEVRFSGWLFNAGACIALGGIKGLDRDLRKRLALFGVLVAAGSLTIYFSYRTFVSTSHGVCSRYSAGRVPRLHVRSVP